MVCIVRSNSCSFLLQNFRYQLIWFQGQVNTFHVSLGGDGAPFGKDDTACAWLVSLLNIGRGVLKVNLLNKAK